MVGCDALIVGGGPAGSTCARVLHQAGWHVIVMDRARFPRDKVCAGWVTPGVFRLLDLDPAAYRATGLTIQDITGFRTSVMGGPCIETRYPRVVSHAIRRCEFDDFLLRRSGAEVLHATPLTSLEKRGDAWVANSSVVARVVVGAGGHFCPVARQLRTANAPLKGSGDEPAAQRPLSARQPEPRIPNPEPRGPDPEARVRPVVAREAEFKLDAGDSIAVRDIPELFFCRDLEGYGWCVRKGDYLNIGLGRRENGDLNVHVQDFIAFMERHGLARRASQVRWRGHAYLASGTGPRPLIGDGVLVVGDSAGLAYPESGEGIRPAVESGRLAAETLIAARGRTTLDDLKPYEDELRRRYPASRPAPQALAGAVRALGRGLLRSPFFTRRVLIDRWFLRESS